MSSGALEAMISSMRKIMLETSVADEIACVLTRSGSITLRERMLTTLPLKTSSPAWGLRPLRVCALRSAISVSMTCLLYTSDAADE